MLKVDHSESDKCEPLYKESAELILWKVLVIIRYGLTV